MGMKWIKDCQKGLKNRLSIQFGSKLNTEWKKMYKMKFGSYLIKTPFEDL